MFNVLMPHLPFLVLGPYCRRSEGWIAVPVCECEIGREWAAGASSLQGVPANTLQIHPSPDIYMLGSFGVLTMYDWGVSAACTLLPGT